MKLPENIKQNSLYKKTEKSFVDGTYESFLRHDFLLLSNIFLTIIMIAELILIFIFNIKDWHFFHQIDFFFGVIFLIEFVLRLVFACIPNKIYFKPYLSVNFIVMVSLLWPNLFFNLAFLRIIRSLKVIKVYLYDKEKKKDNKNSNYNGILHILKTAIITTNNFILRKVSLKK